MIIRLVGMIELFQSFGLWAGHIFSVNGVLLLLLGVALGLVMGAIPGMGAMTTLVLVLPFTYGWDPLDAFLLLPALFGATTVGGSVAAILINIPGTPENIMTMVDGYPLAKQGRAVEALATSGLSSMIGSLLGIMIFIILVPLLLPVALLFGPPEVFWLGLFTLVVLATVTGGSFLVNITVGALAFILSFVGMGPLTGVPRFTYDIMYLQGGIPLIPALVGTFAIAETIKLFAEGKKVAAEKVEVAGSRMEAVHNVIRNKLLILRSAGLGFLIGAIPGVGGTTASYLAYGQAVQTCKNPENFGKGDIRGVIAPESSNNAKDVGQLIPTLALGIPGSGTMTVFLGALILHGITPGPFIMRDHFDVVTMVVFTLALAFSISCLVVIFGGKYFSKVLQIDASILEITILIVSIIATYFVRYQLLDLAMMLGFGVLGYVVMKLNGSRILLILPLILGPIIESNFIVSLQICLGDYSYFFGPISIVLILVMMFSISLPFIRRRRRGGNYEELKS